jgi:hypothetical protein
MRSVKILQALALIVIAIAVTTDHWITHVNPGRLLEANSEEYSRLVVKCELAKTSWDELENGTTENPRFFPENTLSDTEIYNLITSARIELIACHEREKLRQSLLRAGVSFASLAHIELVAKENHEVPIHRLVDRYAREP